MTPPYIQIPIPIQNQMQMQEEGGGNLWPSNKHILPKLNILRVITESLKARIMTSTLLAECPPLDDCPTGYLWPPLILLHTVPCRRHRHRRPFHRPFWSRERLRSFGGWEFRWFCDDGLYKWPTEIPSSGWRSGAPNRQLYVLCKWNGATYNVTYLRRACRLCGCVKYADIIYLANDMGHLAKVVDIMMHSHIRSHRDT